MGFVLIVPVQQEPSGDPTEILNAIQHVRPGNNFQPAFTLFARADVNGQNRLSVYSWALVSTLRTNSLHLC